MGRASSSPEDARAPELGGRAEAAEAGPALPCPPTPPVGEDDPAEQIRLVVGLGNPGPRYEWTRHNAGFLVLDRLLADSGASWVRRAEWEEAELLLTDRDEAGRSEPAGLPEQAGLPEPAGLPELAVSRARVIRLVRPLTFMNRSGRPVAAVLADLASPARRMLVVVDDTALPEGRVRVRERGSAGGHNGIASIVESLGTEDFPRLRLGVGDAPDGADLAEHVLETLQGEALKRLRSTVERGEAAVRLACAAGVRAAMNRFNPMPPWPPLSQED